LSRNFLVFMKTFYEKCIRPALFRMDAERAYDFSIACYRTLGQFRVLAKFLQKINLEEARRPVSLFGLHFPNRVGLSAGFDKSAECWEGLSALGFGFIEIGSVTSERQPGNLRPRVFFNPYHEACVNNTGLNNDGAKSVARRLARGPLKNERALPIGINIGKMKSVPLENAIQDFWETFRTLADFADYFTLNLSNPNLPKLQTLQHRSYLADLLKGFQAENEKRAKKLGAKKIPILLKISPDMSFAQLDEVISIAQDNAIAGIVACNTTTTPPSTMRYKEGGISGKPLFQKTFDRVRYIHKATEGRLPVIASGGILDAVSAGAMIDAGASLLQIHTGFLFNGPSFPNYVKRAIAEKVRPWL